jgi:RND family efflux transporter MFP subunit
MSDNQFVQGHSAQPPPSRAGVRIALIVFAAAIVGLIAFVGVRVKQASGKRAQVAADRALAQAAADKKEPVQWVAPDPVRYKARVEVTGTLKPWREAEVGFETPGRIVQIPVAAGDVVRGGQVLAVLDASRAGAQLSQAESQTRAAEASLAMAEDNLKRTETLVASKSIPEAQLEQARQQVALAKAQLDGARASAQFARTSTGLHTITAPFPGLVTRAPTGVGGVVNPGAPLIRVEDTSRFRLSATLSEEDAWVVTVGAPAQVTYRDRTVTGKITALVPSLDPATRRAPVEIEVPNDPKSPLLAWGFVRATLGGKGEASGLKIPPNAHRAGSQDEVVLVKDGKAHIVKVTHFVDEDGSWIVKNGLDAADKVVIAPSPDVHEGDPVDLGVRGNVEARTPNSKP